MKWIGQHIYDLVSRFRGDVYLENIRTGTIVSGGYLGLDSNQKIVMSSETGDISGITLTAGTAVDLTSVSGATGGAYAATIGVDVSDFMSNGSAGGLLAATGSDTMTALTYITFSNDAGETDTSLLSILSNQDSGDRFTIGTTTHGATTITTIDDDSHAAHLTFSVDGNIFHKNYSGIYEWYKSGNDDDKFRITVGADGDTLLTTVDDAAAAANFEVEADGDITLDANGQIKLEPASGNNILLDGTVTVDGGSVTGITTLGFDSINLTAVQAHGESFVDNDTSIMTSAAIDDRINSVHTTVQTGKHYRIVNTSFRADIGTTKYYLPLKSQDEQTVLTREENQEVAVCDGRLVSLTWRAEAFNTHTGDATVTFGVETNTVGTSYSGGYSSVETVNVTVNNADDQHLWHVPFSSAKHWDSTDMFVISIQSDTDITGSNERIFITLVIEDDWSTYLGIANTSVTEIDSTP